jgi:FAD/FMN-containing dehydrogenase
VGITTALPQISQEAWTAFRLRIKGQVVLPGDPDYEAAREAKNTIYNRKPAIIVRAEDAADVSRSITFARRFGLPLTVKGGGHSIGGHSVNNGGLVIDMRRMNNIRVDAENRTAWAQSGAVAREFLAAVEPYGLAVPFGDAGSVGLGGITLGGGIGYLVRKHGLTIDNLLGIEMVTADGQIIQATETENAELFWALRGGGGNFGVVTGFQYKLVDVPQIYGGALVLPATKDVIREYAKLSLEAPEELTSISMVIKAPPMPFIPEDKIGTPSLIVFTAYSGDVEKGPEAVAPLRALAEPIADTLGPMPLSGLYAYLEPAEAPARARVRSGFYNEITDDILDATLAFVESAPPSMSFLQVRPIGNGAMNRVSCEATAFSHRDARFMLAIIDHWEDAGEDAQNEAWVDAFWQAIGGSRRGAYSNFLQAEGEARVRESYAAETFDRLAKLKLRYDPTNVFSGNENIPPKPLSAVA